MKRINVFLKIYLMVGFVFGLLHLYISFFYSEVVCSLNPGVAFGLFPIFDQGFLSLAKFLLLFVMVVLLVKYFVTLRAFWPLIAVLSLFVLLNILDRIIHGGVCDYIRIFNLPIFNINDVFIIISLLGIIAVCLYEEIYSKGRK